MQLHSNITEADVVIGQADDRDASVFRIAATLADWNIWGESDNNQLDEGEWDSTDKHRVMFVIKKSKLEELGRESRHELWRHGRLHFVLSAPQASYARWRMKVAPDLDVKRRIETLDDDGQPVTELLTTQDVFFGILLSWVGNGYFAHEALRRSPKKALACSRLCSMCKSAGMSSPISQSQCHLQTPQSQCHLRAPQSQCPEPMPSASSEPSDRAAHSATVQNLLPSSPGSSSDSSDLSAPRSQRYGCECECEF